MNSKSYEALRKLSRGRFSTTDFARLKLLARNTVGHPEDFLLQEMDMVIALFSQLDSKVEETFWNFSICSFASVIFSSKCFFNFFYYI